MPLDPQKLAMLAALLHGGAQGGQLPGMPSGPQPPGMLPAPAPAPSPQIMPDQVASPSPIDTSSPDMSAPGQTGAPMSTNSLMPQRNGDMYNPPFTGQEPTAQPDGASPPVNNMGRSPLGALLLPPLLSQLIQKIPNG